MANHALVHPFKSVYQRNKRPVVCWGYHKVIVVPLEVTMDPGISMERIGFVPITEHERDAWGAVREGNL